MKIAGYALIAALSLTSPMSMATAAQYDQECGNDCLERYRDERGHCHDLGQGVEGDWCWQWADQNYDACMQGCGTSDDNMASLQMDADRFKPTRITGLTAIA